VTPKGRKPAHPRATVQQETATPKTNKQLFMDTRPRRLKRGDNRNNLKNRSMILIEKQKLNISSKYGSVEVGNRK
jgi:hypothetical protein